MPNTFSNLNQTIISRAALEAFNDTLMPLTAFANNLSADAVQRGDKIKVLWVPDQDEATDFNGTYSIGTAAASGLDVAIDRHKQIGWGLTDKELAEQPQISLEMFGKKKGFALAKAVLLDIWGLITAAKYGAPVFTTTASLFDSDDVVDISAALDDAKWPEMGRSLIIANSLHAQLRKDGSLKDSSAFGGSEVIRRGQIPTLDKFDAIYGSSIIPANGERLIGFAALPDAMLVAMRYLQPQEGNTYSVAEPVTAPETGFTLGMRQWYENNEGKSKVILEANYGFRIGNAAALKRIVAPEPEEGA